MHIDCIESGIIVTCYYYIENSLKPLFHEIKKQRPKSGTLSMKILHDNMKSHVTKAVLSYLEEENIINIRQPHYSTDLVPCEFQLFDYIKCSLGDHLNEDSLKREITKTLKNIPEFEYKNDI